jgi:glutathione synthase/RimK-type ligase-like ATP-grasp enzyme
VTDVLLVTCAALPDGEDGGELLLGELADRGVKARWVAWDDPDVAWDEAGLVAVRSAWDYEHRRAEFLSWAASVDTRTRLLNGARVFDWNTDKFYLLGLIEAGLPVVPTVSADDEAQLVAAIAAHPQAVVKPRVGASGRGVVVFDGADGAGADVDRVDVSRLAAGPWIVQPLVRSVRTHGETSVFVLGGEVVSQVRKVPGAGEIRVHEQYGGRSVAVAITGEAAALAAEVVHAAEELLDATLDYARVDLMRLDDGSWVLGELEATEPGLYLDVVPENAAAFAATVASLLRG